MNKKYFIYIGIIIVLIGGIFSINYIMDNNHDEIINDIALLDEDIITTTINDNYLYVDIKGEVKNPGVYKVSEGMIVNDVIVLAGGLTKNATTLNINLATKVKDGMVIIINKKGDITTTVKSIITTTNIINNDINDNSNLVNINTASKEELLTITGIGASKADQIIEYRKNNPFKTIEDIMNVSGIGESLFAKIKEYITV